MIKIVQEDNGKEGSFALYENDEFAGELTYIWADETRFNLEHTRVKEQYAGKGYGKQLVLKVVEFARSKNLKILVHCPYAKSVFVKDETIQDVMY